jgi:hypothetical protein
MIQKMNAFLTSPVLTRDYLIIRQLQTTFNDHLISRNTN